jgi:hypothetical protein
VFVPLLVLHHYSSLLGQALTLADSDEEPDDPSLAVKWPKSTDLVLNEAGIPNLGLQHPKIKAFMETSIAHITEYAYVHDAFPNFTRKGAFIKDALLVAAKDEQFSNIRSRIKLDRRFTSKIAHVVRSSVSPL